MPINVTRLTNNSISDTNVQVSGTNVVWIAGGATAAAEIMLYNGATTTQLTTNAIRDLAPQVSGTNVVWQSGTTTTTAEIYLYNGTSTTRLTNNSTSDASPQVNGTNVVWIGSDGDNEIYLYNGTSTTQLSNNAINDGFPRVSGTNVVWQQGLNSETEIMLYNGATTTQLTTNNGNDQNPQVSGTNVVWLSNANDSSNIEVMLYNGTSTTNLTNSLAHESTVQVSGANVVWVGSDGDDEIYLYNGTSTTQITNNATNDGSPQVSGTNVVWTGFDGDTEIYLYNGTSTTQITNNTISDGSPQVSGTNIVWTSGTSTTTEIYLAQILPNSAPTDITVSNSSIAENTPAPALVGTLSSSDPDAGNTFTYSLVSGTGSEDNSAFSISGDQLLAINALDFENKSTYSIRVQTTDSEGASFEKVLGINVTDVVENSAPTDISVSNSSIAENTPAPALVGTLSSSDADTGDTFTYSLVSGTGSEDNSAFSISGDQLLASNAFDFESQSTYSILVQTTDSQGASFEKVLGINVTDVDESGSLSVSDASVIEGNSGTTTAKFVVSLSEASSSYVLVDVNTSNYVAAGSDYQTVSTTVTFNPGETSQTVSVSINGDTTREPNERFLVKLANPVGGILDNSIGVGTILNDDYSLPSINITDSSITEGNSGTTYGEFTVSLSASSSVPVSLNYSTVNYSAIGGTDFLGNTTALTFNPGETTKTISVGILGDTTKETNEKFLVSLTSPINATWNNRIGVGTILNDDGLFSPPLISVTDGSITEGDSGTKNLDFTVSLSASSASNVTLNYSTNNSSGIAGSDYQGIPTTSLTFNPGETTKTISVAVLGDNTIEGTERFFLNLSGAVGGNFENRIATATIFDNDTPPTINITDSTVTEGNTGRTDSNFVVSLSQASTKTVTVAYNTTGGTASSAQNSDYVGIPAATLTFNPGETQKTISVKVNGDSLIETTERFFLNLSSSVNGTFENRLGVGTILNDDLTAPSIPFRNKLTVESAINASDFSGSKGASTSFLAESDRLFDNPLAIIPIPSDVV